MTRNAKQFITEYQFKQDRRRKGRLLDWVKVGDVYISRLTLKDKAIIGNLYYRSTDVVFFVEKGKIKTKFVQAITEEEKEMVVGPGDGIIHLPPYVAFSFKNIRVKESVLIMISDKPLRSKDDKEFIIYEE
ncbi:MAG: cupin domain-containing protein [Candidatus Magasanikbacteria bacterium]|jgi:mannose-6-phosphate isomerase-like protein (cupin superfamily)|nr:cupin domain-containing protein [Candidatus Magasanikbacteria bacterium]MBT4221052.1 cupin domain-containing protein [Candidatus Magasanikbacteria bacterium]MBT4350604.1 cupin domain-containing protein [Candidatus Magasanikbacteria bacterium]MBT4542097.1 cupin domain-containing protein [Candidatus Magasanikbacteria bacterium]MBT6253219.1 cupin domain-containing protein [Candidatus Magasanikbacteria bacterium]